VFLLLTIDAGTLSSSGTLKTLSRYPLQEQFIQRKSSKENLDRFTVMLATCLRMGIKDRREEIRNNYELRASQHILNDIARNCNLSER